MRKRLFSVGWLLFVSWTASAQDASQPDGLLSQVRNKMIANLARLPNYTCLQTIERKVRHPSSRRTELVDMVRLEVALVDGKELFSWPGAGHFEDKEIGQLVSGGAIGNGSFALHAKSIFQSRAARITYIGEVTRNNRKLLRWDYEVPQKRSSYTLRSGSHDAIVGYHGSFWVDPLTFDVLRLEVEADEIPPELRIARAMDAVEYARLNIGTQNFLLPQSASLTMVDDEDSESMNQTRFTGCRQYTGESVLVFNDLEPGAAAPVPVTSTIEVPAGLNLELRLDTAIGSQTSAVGDPITAVLEKALKKNGTTIAPKGALLHGRIMTLRRQNVDNNYYVVGLDFSTIEFPGTIGTLRAEMDQIMAAGNAILNPGVTRPGVNPRLNAVIAGARLNFPGSVFFVRGESFKLTRGLYMFWHTLTPTKENRQ